MTRHYFGIASIIFAVACLTWSVGQAIAVPMGPNVSLGTNPIFSVNSSTNTAHTLYTNNTSSTAVITDFIATGYINYTCTRTFSVTNGTEAISINDGSDGVYHLALGSGLKVLPGESLDVSGGNYCSNVSISGYYAH